eukprot:755438-Hanusia_phi.AAC.1
MGPPARGRIIAGRPSLPSRTVRLEPGRGSRLSEAPTGPRRSGPGPEPEPARRSDCRKTAIPSAFQVSSSRTVDPAGPPRRLPYAEPQWAWSQYRTVQGFIRQSDGLSVVLPARRLAAALYSSGLSSEPARQPVRSQCPACRAEYPVLRYGTTR